MALIIFQQAKGAKRSITFDFTESLATSEVITSQATALAVHSGLGDAMAVGQITDIARDSDDKKISLAYSNTAAGFYVIEVTATTANQVIKQKVIVEVV